ncbi:MAG: hypothetical protein KDA37_12525 [Planctomycetales bacterium]|nr:hypothetical protein [Planctomycetales bacterium]MCB1029522.1 hypothetical protein [Microthrixaceae bacterium]MCB1222139.1 hypothetical protein [bacterium]
MRDAHQSALLDAACRLNIEVDDRRNDWGVDAVYYRYGGRELLVFDGRITQGLSHTAAQVCLNKLATRSALVELDLPVPAALLASANSRSAVESLMESGPVVCKPSNGEWGDGVLMDLTMWEQVADHIEHLCGLALVEEQLHGMDLRIQALGGTFEVACTRVPAEVVGNGSTNIASLVSDLSQQVIARNPDNRFVLDEVTVELLQEQGLTLNDVPAAGRNVKLKRVANLSQGGRAIDVTEGVHSDYYGWVEAIGEHLDMDFFAVDIVCEDPAQPPRESGAKILEINAPCQWLSHTFSDHQTHDLPAKILTHLLRLP